MRWADRNRLNCVSGSFWAICTVVVQARSSKSFLEPPLRPSHNRPRSQEVNSKATSFGAPRDCEDFRLRSGGFASRVAAHELESLVRAGEQSVKPVRRKQRLFLRKRSRLQSGADGSGRLITVESRRVQPVLKFTDRLRVRAVEQPEGLRTQPGVSRRLSREVLPGVLRSGSRISLGTVFFRFSRFADAGSVAHLHLKHFLHSKAGQKSKEP